MTELLENGTTLLYVSHSLDDIRSMCTKVLWLDHGRVVQAGDTKMVCDAYIEAQEKR